MPIIASSASKTMQTIPAGTHVARCVGMIHIGTIPNTFNGESKLQNRVWVTWETPDETIEFKEGEGKKPYWISREYTLSMHEKSKLREHVEGWRGKGLNETQARSFDIEKLLGQPCLLNIIHNDKGYANINGIASLPKGMSCSEQVSETRVLTYDNFNKEIFESLPQFLKDKMKESLEYRALSNTANTVPVIDVNEDKVSEDTGLPF